MDGSGSLAEFEALCNALEAENTFNGKTGLVAKFMKTFKGDAYLVCKLLLPKADTRKYSMKEKQIVKVLSRVLNAPLPAMIADLENGNVTLTAKKFYIAHGKPANESNLTLHEVDTFLESLSDLSKEEDQVTAFKSLLPRLTPSNMKTIIGLVRHDLGIAMGPKFVLDALHPDAFTAYKNCNNLKQVVTKVLGKSVTYQGEEERPSALKKTLSTGISLMSPIRPMLAKAVKSIAEVMQRFPDGFFSEIKYDGERIQIHKDGESITCFSRTLKPILPWKVAEVKDYIPQAISANQCILDGEILLMDVKTHTPLPFGTLGIHKKTNFTDATVCIFLFDILYLNGESLISMPIIKRRAILEDNLNVIPNRIELSELSVIHEEEDLCTMLNRCDYVITAIKPLQSNSK